MLPQPKDTTADMVTTSSSTSTTLEARDGGECVKCVAYVPSEIVFSCSADEKTETNGYKGPDDLDEPWSYDLKVSYRSFGMTV